jgi:hypothetical protein
MSENRFEELFTKRPCIGCMFFGACGDLLRTEECEERMTQSQYMRLGQDQNGERENR